MKLELVTDGDKYAIKRTCRWFESIANVGVSYFRLRYGHNDGGYWTDAESAVNHPSVWMGESLALAVYSQLTGGKPVQDTPKSTVTVSID